MIVETGVGTFSNRSLGGIAILAIWQCTLDRIGLVNGSEPVTIW
jgi:hypothetical protein